MRATERRFALTAEWAVKAVYAKAIGALAGLSPAPLEIESVVSGVDESDLIAIPDVRVVRDLGDGKQLVVTPRYAAFTQIVRNLAVRSRQIFEIAGNDIIFATVLVPNGADIIMPGVQSIFSDTIQSRPGWRRQGVQVRVPDLINTIQELKARGAVLEHLYDY